mgnify:CR=1 FL=1
MGFIFKMPVQQNFHIGGIDLHQILVTKGVNNELPLTRWY